MNMHTYDVTCYLTSSGLRSYIHTTSSTSTRYATSTRHAFKAIFWNGAQAGVEQLGRDKAYSTYDALLGQDYRWLGQRAGQPLDGFIPFPASAAGFQPATPLTRDSIPALMKAAEGCSLLGVAGSSHTPHRRRYVALPLRASAPQNAASSAAMSRVVLCASTFRARIPGMSDTSVTRIGLAGASLR